MEEDSPPLPFIRSSSISQANTPALTLSVPIDVIVLEEFSHSRSSSSTPITPKSCGTSNPASIAAETKASARRSFTANTPHGRGSVSCHLASSLCIRTRSYPESAWRNRCIFLPCFLMISPNFFSRHLLQATCGSHHGTNA